MSVFSDTVSGAWFPHVNLCVPAAVICPAIVDYQATGDAAALRRRFATEDVIVQKLWTLRLGLFLQILSFSYLIVRPHWSLRL